MFERFRDSIILPAKIVDYRNDKVIWVILYILFFAVLLSTRTIIFVSTFQGLTEESRNNIVSSLPEFDETCSFSAVRFSCDTEQTTLVFHEQNSSYYLESHEELQMDAYDSPNNIVIHDDSIYIITSGIIMFEEPLTTHLSDLMHMDFSLQSEDPDLFHAKILSAVDSFVLGYQAYWGLGLIVRDILVSTALFFAFVLLSAWMLRLRFPEIPFRQTFVMTGYSGTAMYLILIFNSLYNLQFFIVIILIVIAFRQNNQLSYEIIRRLQQRKP